MSTWSIAGLIATISSITSGVSESETSVAILSPTFRSPFHSGPISSTVPISIPPEPVHGFLCLPALATIPSIVSFIFSISSAVRSSPGFFPQAWSQTDVNEAESMFSV